MRLPFSKKYFLPMLAILAAIGFHGSLIPYTFTKTYDAFVHIFFADHYARYWFDHWELRWYTGFTMTSYPPGSHQLVALISWVTGLKTAYVLVQLIAVLVLIIGVYRFSKIWVGKIESGWATIFAVFSASIAETIHVFGQLPTVFSLGLLLNALPFVYYWVERGRLIMLMLALTMTAAATVVHHVTPLFGLVFFISPVFVKSFAKKTLIGIKKRTLEKRPSDADIEKESAYKDGLTLSISRAALFGFLAVFLLLFLVFPYWYLTKTDPISQVPIPHASRDSFFDDANAALVFFIIPYGVMLIAIPYIIARGTLSRLWPIGLTFIVLFVLGLGGTTPIPKLLLQHAFDILTFDRFTFWASIISLPIMGLFLVSLFKGTLKIFLRNHFGNTVLRIVQVSVVAAHVGTAIMTVNLTNWRTMQPPEIDINPILKFIDKDEHYRWRYLTLGFGDQVAWLSANTLANTVDGNYHSARRLPELTTTPIERLEGAKFKGVPGIGSLQQFLTVPEKYNLKYIFSNDKFYDPLLFFSGWQRLGRLENGILVWERLGIPTLPKHLPRKEIPPYQRIMWGGLPISTLLFGLIVMALYVLRFNPFKRLKKIRSRAFIVPAFEWRLMCKKLDYYIFDQMYATLQKSFFKHFLTKMSTARHSLRQNKAPRNSRIIRSSILIGVSAVYIIITVIYIITTASKPENIVASYLTELDFRRFRSAYDLLDPKNKPSFEEYTVGLGVQNGLLTSYAVMDSLKTKTVDQGDTTAKVTAKINWLTPLKNHENKQLFQMIKRNGSWYIKYEKRNLSSPYAELIRENSVLWKGPSTPTTENKGLNYIKRIQDRPELHISTAKIVKYKGMASIVGEVVNIDNDIADLTLTAEVFSQNQLAGTNNAQTVVKHKLLPYESTPFRIDFRPLAGNFNATSFPGKNFPDSLNNTKFFSHLDPSASIDGLSLFAKSNVSSKTQHRNLMFDNVKTYKNKSGKASVKFTLHNTGTREATIPQIFVSYYDKNNELTWVEHHFLDYGILPRFKQEVNITLKELKNFKKQDTANAVFINGKEVSLKSKKRPPNAIDVSRISNFDYIKIDINYMVGDEI